MISRPPHQHEGARITLIEKAARSLMERHRVDPESYISGLGWYRYYLDAARVIAEVLAEPTEKMVAVGLDQTKRRGGSLRATTLAKCYEAMIATVLAE